MSFLLQRDDKPPKKRKKYDGGKKSYDDIIAVGYQCKIFRDDVMASYIEEGKHLIPWMGDESILVDRYDCRGHLYSLDDFGLANVDSQIISGDDQLVENECDKLRYFGLDLNAMEQTVPEGDELRNQNNWSKKSEIGYHYDDDKDDDGGKEYDPNECYHGDDSDQEAEDRMVKLPRKPMQRGFALKEEDTKQGAQYIKPEGLNIPEGIDVPDSQKSHSIIEKTALFISKHGTQMEIILKAKQAGNPQFDFLNFGNWLNPYYKLILGKLKDGSYEICEAENESKTCENTQASKSDSESESDDDEYIHPLLQAHRRPIKTQGEATSAQPIPQHTTQSSVPRPLPQKAYANAAEVYMARKYANLRKNIANEKDENEPNENWADELEEDKNFSPYDAQHYKYMSEIEQHYSQFGTLPFMQVPPPPPSDSTSDPKSQKASHCLPPPPPPPGCVAGDSENGDDIFSHQQQQQEHIVPPPPDLKVVVDKLAEYVSRNGEDFEAQIKLKKDPRFDFLIPNNIYYPYYLYKKQKFILEINKNKATIQKEEEEKTSKPFSFALKSKKRAGKADSRLKPVEIFNASPDNSDDEVNQDLKDNFDGYRPNIVMKGQIQKDRTMEEKAKETIEKAKMMIAENQRKQEELNKTSEFDETDVKESQIQKERRRKAAAFIGMLKKVKQNEATSSSSESSDEDDASRNEDVDETNSQLKRHFKETKLDDGS